MEGEVALAVAVSREPKRQTRKKTTRRKEGRVSGRMGRLILYCTGGSKRNEGVKE